MEKSRVFQISKIEGENRDKVEHFLGMCGFEVFPGAISKSEFRIALLISFSLI